MPALFPGPVLIIMAAAFAALVPFFFWGNPSGHDFEFHLSSWMEVVSQWQQGIIYPRWAALAHWGYGEARFVFYPPVSWTLGAMIGALLPWKMASGAYIWIALTASGASMFVLARRWLDRGDATFAAALHTVNPYYLLIVYWRSAFAELLTGALLPLLLLCVMRLEQGGRRAFVPLAMVIAAAWLTNAPAAVMVNYSVALLIVVLAVLRRSPRILVRGGLGVALGLALAAFYVLPAAFEEKWVNIGEVLSPGVRPQENFLFTIIADPDHNRFNLLVSAIAAAEMAVLAAAAWLWRRERMRKPELWWTLMAWAGAAVLLMLPFAFLLWEHLPELRFVQLPWRWLLCMNVAFALIVSMGVRRWFSRVVICVALLVIVVSLWRHVQPPWWDTAADIEEMRGGLAAGQGYEGIDEYVPAGADPYELDKSAPRVAVEGRIPARIQLIEWGAETKRFVAEVGAPSKLVLRLFNYPAWKVEVNARAVAAESSVVTGQMVIPVAAGENRVRIMFSRTWDRTVGRLISGVTGLLLCALFFNGRRRHRKKASQGKSAE